MIARREWEQPFNSYVYSKKLHNMHRRLFNILACNCKWNRVQNSQSQAKAKKKRFTAWLHAIFDWWQRQQPDNTVIPLQLHNIVHRKAIFWLGKMMSFIGKYKRKYHTRNIDAVFKVYVPNDIAIKLAEFGRESTPTLMTCYFLCFRKRIPKETTKNTQQHINYHQFFSQPKRTGFHVVADSLFRSGIFNSIAR